MEAVPKEGTCVRTTPTANNTQHSTFCPSVSGHLSTLRSVEGVGRGYGWRQTGWSCFI